MKKLALALLLVATPAVAQDGPSYGPNLEGYDYPFPVQHYRFQSQGVAMDMAYMDIKPAQPTGASARAGATNKEVRTIVLLHGKNFCAGTWIGSIKALTEA